MANTRAAKVMARKLGQLDHRITREYLKEKYDRAKINQLEAQKTALLKEAQAKGLKLVSVQVADGSALYYETKRTKTLATFEWLYGGSDGYVSGWGKVVAIPLTSANKLIKQFSPTSI